MLWKEDCEPKFDALKCREQEIEGREWPEVDDVKM